MAEPFLIARATDQILFPPSVANRHGLIAGATGTGKTVTLRVLAENFSAMGTAVFMADVKGDLSGLAKPGNLPGQLEERARTTGLQPYTAEAFPVTFWDVFGEAGHPIRTTISEMGPLLLARLLGLNETQEGVLTLVFKAADDAGLLLLDLKDLRAALQHVGENAREITLQYGNVSSASIGAIQRQLLALEQQGGDRFFGEPALNLADFLQTDEHGRGVINLLSAERLIQSPRTYAAMLLWLLSELFEELPEVGDLEKPKLVFFFDEAHLLFTDIPRALQEKIEQVVRLIRSKGVGVYFVTQNPLDLPEKVLGQLGHRIQHALRAFTPRDQKAVKVAAETFRANPALDTEAVLTQLAVGEALISLLDEKGQPQVVERAMVVPPRSQLPPITTSERAELIGRSMLHGTYEQTVDRESAFEILAARAQEKGATGAEVKDQPSANPLTSILFGSTGPRGGKREGLVESMAKSAVRTMGSTVGREIIRGVLGGLFGGSRRRR
jgi:DNA helicase HerA-like ATPase